MTTPLVAVTGHRWYENQEPPGLRDRLHDTLWDMQPEVVLTGMALGFDQLVAYVCVWLEIPFIACVPCEGQEARWPLVAKRRYYSLIQKAKHVQFAPGGPYAAWKFLERDRYVVGCAKDHGGPLVAYYRGTPGGTQYTVDYATKQGVRIINLAEVTA